MQRWVWRRERCVDAYVPRPDELLVECVVVHLRRGGAVFAVENRRVSHEIERVRRFVERREIGKARAIPLHEVDVAFRDVRERELVGIDFVGGHRQRLVGLAGLRHLAVNLRVAVQCHIALEDEDVTGETAGQQIAVDIGPRAMQVKAPRGGRGRSR